MRQNRILPLSCRNNTAKWAITLAFLIIFIDSICSVVAVAETASPDEMELVCRNWLTYTVSKTGGWAGDIYPEITDIQDIIENDTLLGRYYSVSSGGFVIVPALKNMPPVRFYSDESDLDIDEQDGMALMIREVLQHRIRLYVEVYGSLEAIPPSEEEPLFGIINRDRWDDFAISPNEFAASANKSLQQPTEGIGPLLTSSWHQSYPYNAYCPMGDGGRCVVGCLATAIAQIMWYHQWPPFGNGSYSYTWDGDNSCGGSTPSQTLSADFSDPYIYESTLENLAEINYEVGVVIDMDYGYCGSGAYFTPVFAAMVNNFMYDESITSSARPYYNSQSWFDLVVEQINQGHPILYGIFSHAIVCDGWRIQDDLNQYHMNYGWGGDQTLWYVVDHLHCPWDGCGLNQESMIRNIIPKNGNPWLGANTLSDDAFGDGDGIPEAGETIELTFTIANYGGAEITDVEINLSIDDASVPITDGYVYLGTIPERDSVENTGDPLVFDIPIDYIPRIDSFMLEINWNGTESDTLVIEKSIGRATVLLVDDDNGGGVETYYQEALASFRIPSNIRDVSDLGSPDSAFLADYDFVIWFSGDYQTTPLSGIEINAMRGFMNRAGNLFLTGQGIAAQLDSYDPTFLNSYLRSDYQSTMIIPALATVPGGQVFDSGYMVAIHGGNSASNQTDPDFIVPINSGMAELLYLGQVDYGAVSYSGDYKLVFFSFGFEAIVSDDGRWRDRDSVFSDIINFFGYQKPDGCPQVLDLGVVSGETMNLIDHTPDFTWTYIDGESSPQAMYQFQVGSDADWDIAEMWDDGPVSGTDNQITYAGLELHDGEAYYVRARAYDGGLWSNWDDIECRMNSVPSVCTDLSPNNMIGLAGALPELSHTNGVDAQYDNMTHRYEVYDDPELTILVADADDQPATYVASSWTVDVPLSDDEDYYWRVRGSDPYEDGEWSETASFWVNSTNQIPDPFDLLAPEDSILLPDLLPTFTWSASTDSDLHDVISYTLFYSPDSTFSTTISIGDLDTTSYTLTEPLSNGNIYFWKVKAIDGFGGETTSNQVFTCSTLLMGDANSDGNIDVGDAVYLITYVFRGGPPPDPIEAGDANCDSDCNVGDAVFLISYIFKGGPEPGCK